MNDPAVDKLEVIKLLLKTEHPDMQKQILSSVIEYLNIENINYYNAIESAIGLVRSQAIAYYDRTALHNPDATQNIDSYHLVSPLSK